MPTEPNKRQLHRGEKGTITSGRTEGESVERSGKSFSSALKRKGGNVQTFGWEDTK